MTNNYVLAKMCALHAKTAEIMTEKYLNSSKNSLDTWDHMQAFKALLKANEDWIFSVCYLLEWFAT